MDNNEISIGHQIVLWFPKEFLWQTIGGYSVDRLRQSGATGHRNRDTGDDGCRCVAKQTKGPLES